MRKLPSLDELKDMRAAGMTLQQIGNRYNASKQAVHTALKQDGHTYGNRQCLPTMYPPKHVMDHWRKQGRSPEEIAKLCSAFDNTA